MHDVVVIRRLVAFEREASADSKQLFLLQLDLRLKQIECCRIRIAIDLLLQELQRVKLACSLTKSIPPRSLSQR